MSATPPSPAGRDAESRRQQALWQALRSAGAARLPPGARALPGPHGRAPEAEGVLAGQAHAHASAHRALLARYPVLATVLGDSAMQALARDLWQAHPPRRGDLACFGDEAGDWLAARQELTAWPWLPDLARLETLLHQAERAADVPPDVAERGLRALGEQDPDRFALVLAPGSACLDSVWPLAELWQAHAGAQACAGLPPETLHGLQQLLAAPQARSIWVWRRAWRASAVTLDEGTAAWHAELRRHPAPSLGAALRRQQRHMPRFDFAAWLRQALDNDWLAGCVDLPAATWSASE